MKTYLPKPDANSKKWYIVNAEGKTLGRLATKIAVVLRGKHKPDFTPHLDTGDFVVVVNAEKISYTGNKYTDKMYYHHTQYPNGLKTESMKKIFEENPDRIIKKAVWGMLPKDRLGRDLFKKLKVYTGPAHPHKAQSPVQLP